MKRVFITFFAKRCDKGAVDAPATRRLVFAGGRRQNGPWRPCEVGGIRCLVRMDRIDWDSVDGSCNQVAGLWGWERPRSIRYVFGYGQPPDQELVLLKATKRYTDVADLSRAHHLS